MPPVFYLFQQQGEHLSLILAADGETLVEDDGPRELVHVDAYGIVHTYRDTPEGVQVTSQGDVAPVLEANVVEYNSGNSGKGALNFMRKVARVPMEVALKWREIYGVDVLDKNHAPAVKRLLNSNEWRYLRTAPGTL